MLLSTAAESIQKCQALVDEDQVGLAYVQFLRASEIVVNIIPRHADYRMLPSQHPDWYARFSNLMLVSYPRPFLRSIAMPLLT